jgi:HEAT repeat protein
VLNRGLDAPDEWTQWEAVNALGTVHDGKTVPALIEKLKSEYGSVAREAVLSLGRIRDRAAVPPLMEALGHTDPEMRWRAAMALERLGDPRALPALKDQLRQEKDKFARRQLREAIEQFGKS